MEGSRPILSEIQALATKTNFPAPRRACSGYDYNRMNLLIAVLEKRAWYIFGNLDVYVNIVGGIALRDTCLLYTSRRGEFKTVHGTVQTPAFQNVATAGAIKGGLSAQDLKDIGAQATLLKAQLHRGPLTAENSLLSIS